MQQQTHFGDYIIREYVYNPDTLIKPDQQLELIADYYSKYLKESRKVNKRQEVSTNVHNASMGKQEDTVCDRRP